MVVYLLVQSNYIFTLQEEVQWIFFHLIDIDAKKSKFCSQNLSWEKYIWLKNHFWEFFQFLLNI